MTRGNLDRVHSGLQFVAARSCRVAAVSLLLCAVAWLAMSSHSLADVVIFDGFEDADRDNDGTTDIGTVVDSNDVGIKWFSVNGLVSTFHDPFLSVQSSPAPEFETGNALLVSPIGGDNSDWAGFFPERITLGPSVGDQLVVTFDIYHDATLLNPGGNTTTLRFGLWQDSDGQLGMGSFDGSDTNPNDPREDLPTVWGGTDGYFENCAFSPIGTCGDFGIWGRVQSGTSTVATQADRFSITEEINANISTGGNDDNEGIAIADGLNGNALFSDIAPIDNSPHTVSLTLERVAPDATGQDIRIEVAVDGMAYGAQPPNPVEGMPDNGFIETLDSFDYFMLVQNTDAGNYLIDNFMVELITASAGLQGDYNDDGTVDAADYTVWRDQLGGAVALPNETVTPGTVTVEDYDAWKANFGATSGASVAAASIPEPASAGMVLVALCFSCLAFRLQLPSVVRITTLS